LKFSFYIASRYLVSKKSRNAINIISFISILGVSIGTAALIIILSVFNGFDNLLTKLYNSFDPDIKIIASKGKVFEFNKNISENLNYDFIEEYSLCLEENAMLSYGDKQIVATVKGVDDNYINVTGLDSMIIRGDYLLQYENALCGISGQGIAYDLDLDLDFIYPIKIYIPSRTKKASVSYIDAADNLNQSLIYTAGVFAIQQEYDTKYFILPLSELRKLLEYENEVSSIEIKLKKGENIKKALNKLTEVFGEAFTIQDRNMQHAYAYKIMQSEKWAIFMILVFILLIASFNVIGSLTMLIIEKKNDIQTLKSLGAENKTIRNIFFLEGIFISFIGAILGIIIGSAICLAQIKFGFIKLGNGGSFIIENYPVAMQILDFVWVFITVMIIGLIAAWYPVRYITKKYSIIEY
jgi:lipoprotein-releasing system permease protein